MIISEYMPKRLQRAGLLLKGILVTVAAALLVYYTKELEGLREQEREYQGLRQEVAELRQLLRRGEEALKAGDVREGEGFLLAAVARGTSDTAPYLLLADLYTEYRLYGEALEILDSYGENDAEIAGRAEELRAMISGLEQSVFVQE